MRQATAYLSFFQSNYPELLAKVFLFGVPSVGAAAFNVCLSFLKPKTRSKFQIFANNEIQMHIRRSTR